MTNDTKTPTIWNIIATAIPVEQACDIGYDTSTFAYWRDLSRRSAGVPANLSKRLLDVEVQMVRAIHRQKDQIAGIEQTISAKRIGYYSYVDSTVAERLGRYAMEMAQAIAETRALRRMADVFENAVYDALCDAQ